MRSTTIKTFSVSSALLAAYGLASCVKATRSAESDRAEQQSVAMLDVQCKGCRPHDFDKRFPVKFLHEDEQGPYLEGPGLELYHFPSDGGVTLEGVSQSVAACDSPQAKGIKARFSDCSFDEGQSAYANCKLQIVHGKDVPCRVSDGGVASVVLVKGYWDGQGTFIPGDTVTAGCHETAAGSAIASCIHKFKYLPQTVEPFLACVRMMRADYCGDGCPFTQEHTCIDAYDDGGVGCATCDAGKCGGGLCHEADWGVEGAVSISHMRWDSLKRRHTVQKECKDLFEQVTPPTGSPVLNRVNAGRAYVSDRSQHHGDGGVEPCPAGAYDPACTKPAK